MVAQGKNMRLYATQRRHLVSFDPRTQPRADPRAGVADREAGDAAAAGGASANLPPPFGSSPLAAAVAAADECTAAVRAAGIMMDEGFGDFAGKEQGGAQCSGGGGSGISGSVLSRAAFEARIPPAEEGQGVS